MRNPLRILYMNLPKKDDLDEHKLTETPEPVSETSELTRPRVRRPARRVSEAGDKWESAKTEAVLVRERAELFLRKNPVPAIIGALALGLAIGFAVHYSSRPSRREEIKTPLGNVNWGFLSLPFLWPFFKSVREKYEDSADAMRSGVDRLKKIGANDYAKPIRKRWSAWTR